MLSAKTAWEEPKWGPNLEEFRKRFDPDKTWGEGPKRLKNLYFTFLVELRALAKAAPYLEMVSNTLDITLVIWTTCSYCLCDCILQEDYYTGNEKEDKEVHELVKDLLLVVKSFPEHFDESKLFIGEAKQLKVSWHYWRRY